MCQYNNIALMSYPYVFPFDFRLPLISCPLAIQRQKIMALHIYRLKGIMGIAFYAYRFFYNAPNDTFFSDSRQRHFLQHVKPGKVPCCTTDTHTFDSSSLFCKNWESSLKRGKFTFTFIGLLIWLFYHRKTTRMLFFPLFAQKLRCNAFYVLPSLLSQIAWMYGEARKWKLRVAKIIGIIYGAAFSEMT